MDTDLDTLEKVQACVVPPPSTHRPRLPARARGVRAEGARQAQAGSLPDRARVLARAPELPDAQRRTSSARRRSRSSSAACSPTGSRSARRTSPGRPRSRAHQRRPAPRREGGRRRATRRAHAAASAPSSRQLHACRLRPDERRAPARERLRASAASPPAAPAAAPPHLVPHGWRPSRSSTTTRTCRPPSPCASTSSRWPPWPGRRPRARPRAGSLRPRRGRAPAQAMSVVGASPASYAANAASYAANVGRGARSRRSALRPATRRTPGGAGPGFGPQQAFPPQASAQPSRASAAARRAHGGDLPRPRRASAPPSRSR